MTFFTRTGILSDARKADSLLKTAFGNARSGGAVSLGDRYILKGSNRSSLSVANSHARITWGEAVCGELANFFCDDPRWPEHNQDIHFVTLTDIECATAVSAEDITVEFIARRLRRGLRGLSYFAVIEPAFYVNFQVGVRFQGKRCLSWHLHAIVWDIAKKEMQQRISALEASGWYIAIVPGLEGAHGKLVRQGTLPDLIGYMLKPPVNGYRVSRRDVERNGIPLINDAGEVQAKFKQGKAKLRPGERVSLFHAVKHLHLDKLTIAGGQGVPLLKRAKLKAVSLSRAAFGLGRKGGRLARAGQKTRNHSMKMQIVERNLKDEVKKFEKKAKQVQK